VARNTCIVSTMPVDPRYLALSLTIPINPLSSSTSLSTAVSPSYQATIHSMSISPLYSPMRLYMPISPSYREPTPTSPSYSLTSPSYSPTSTLNLPTTATKVPRSAAHQRNVAAYCSWITDKDESLFMMCQRESIGKTFAPVYTRSQKRKLGCLCDVESEQNAVLNNRPSTGKKSV